jgi:uncharacterized MAPEG superfamily protein
MARDFTAAASGGSLQIHFCDVVNVLTIRWRIPMVLLILLVLALFVLQTLLPACFRYTGGPDTGRKLLLALGPRDDPPPQTRVGGRAERALANIHEALPVFLALALLNLILGTGDLAVTGATVFLVARVLYVPAYLAGLTGVRTLI